MNKDIDKLTMELNGIEMTILGLSFQYEEENTPRLSATRMNSVLIGIASHLERIIADLENL